jgi:hypothetical protein
VWRTSRNSLDTARLMGAFVHDAIEPPLRAPRGGLTRPMRVALVRPKNATGASFSQQVFASLVFNGRSALENGGVFRELTYASEEPEPKDELAPLASELLTFLPQVVLYFGTAPLVKRVVAPLEERWPDPRVPRPRYVAAAHFIPELLEYVGADRERRRRFFGTMLVSSTPQNARFAMHYNETFADHTSLTDAPNTAYDAFYLLAYAAYAAYAGGAPITGASLSRAMARFHPAQKQLEVGMTSIFDVLGALRSGEDVDLVGSSGSLDLDPKIGERPLDHSILCVGIDARGRAFEGIESGLVYRTALGKLEGTMRCP